MLVLFPVKTSEICKNNENKYEIDSEVLNAVFNYPQKSDKIR